VRPLYTRKSAKWITELGKIKVWRSSNPVAHGSIKSRKGFLSWARQM